MSEVVGEARVVVRPQVDQQQFEQQARRQIQTALVGIDRDARRAGGGLRSADGDLGRFTRGAVAANAASLGFGRALTFASAAFLGGAGLGALIRTATDEFGDMVRTMATTRALLRSTGGVANVTADDINRLANSQLQLTGLDDELIAKGANVLLTFRQIRNELGEGNDIFDRAVVAAEDLSVVFGTDLQSSAIQLGKALEDPVRGVTALRRSGVSFTADQQKLIKSLVETGQRLRAQRLILDEVERQVGGTAREVGETLPGQLDVLRERASNALGDYVRRLSDSEDAAETASNAAAGLALAWRGLGVVVRPVVATFELGARVLNVTADASRSVAGFFRDGADAAHGFRTALDLLNDALERGQNRRDASAAAEESATEARLDLADATRTVAEAQRALNQSPAGLGSIERLALEDQLAAAQARQALATEALRRAEERAQAARNRVIVSERQRANVVAETTRRIQQQVAEIRHVADLRAGPLQPTGQLRDFIALTADLQESGRQVDRTVGGTLAAIARQINAIPSQKQIELVVTLAGQGRLSRGILDELGLAEVNEIEEIRIRNAQALQQLSGREDRSLQEQLAALRNLVDRENERLKTSRDRLRVAREEAVAAKDQVRSAREALASAQQALRDAREARSETIRSAADAISGAVRDAKQNLRSIADSVAEALGRITGGDGQVSAALRRRFQELRAQILAGEGGPETQRAAQRVAALAEAQQGGQPADPDRLRRRFADLSDDFARGQISVGQFNRRLDQLLKGFDAQAFGRQFGTAARNDLLDEIRALRRQAGALDAGPQRPGGGAAPTVVSTVAAVRQGAVDVARATREVRSAVRDVSKASQDLQRAQVEEGKAQTRLQRRMAFALEALNRRDAARQRVEGARGNRDKPRGDAGDRTKDVTAAGASPR